MNLRPATIADVEFLLRLRNDPETRRASRSQNEVTPDEHRDWLARWAASPTQTLFIAEVNGVAVGTGRIDWEHPDAEDWEAQVAEVSLTVAPEARGKRFAQHLIVALTEAARMKGATCVVADVRGDNARSLRAFLSSGFTVPGMVRLERSV